ncbi:MAG: hypothetical protein ACI379_13665, partial [Nocardioides sp.]|uniref:hypothetical protein n=1 Tax=Nocardioides sp. TaxID=35761 RepID=UPI003F011F68
MSAWLPALRIATRDGLRHKARSLLVLLMVALPVLAVTVLAVLVRTVDVDEVEGIDRTMGSAEAMLEFTGLRIDRQPPSPQEFGYAGEAEVERPTQAQVLAALGQGSRLVEYRRGDYTRIAVDDRAVDVALIEVDLADPVAEGLF